MLKNIMNSTQTNAKWKPSLIYLNCLQISPIIEYFRPIGLNYSYRSLDFHNFCLCLTTKCINIFYNHLPNTRKEFFLINIGLGQYLSSFGRLNSSNFPIIVSMPCLGLILAWLYLLF